MGVDLGRCLGYSFLRVVGAELGGWVVRVKGSGFRV